MINIKQLTSSERYILKSALDSGILNLDSVQDELMASKIDSIKKKH